MPLAKSANQLLLEGFFGVEFGLGSDPMWKELQFFDDAALWQLTLNEHSNWLLFSINVQEQQKTFATVEAIITFSALKAHTLPRGEGKALDIRPQHTERAEPTGLSPTEYRVTKTPEGRFSLGLIAR